MQSLVPGFSEELKPVLKFCDIVEASFNQPPCAFYGSRHSRYTVLHFVTSHKAMHACVDQHA